MSATPTRPEARISIDHSRSPALPAEAGRSKGRNAAIAAPLTRFAHWTVLAWGWQRAAVAFLAGAVSVLALAPFNLWPVMFLTFPVVVWLIDGSAAARLSGVLTAAGSGWWFGFGYFPAGLALFTALGFALARLMWTRGPTRVLALALALTAAEWLRGHALSGFPWNAYGYALTGPLALAQGAALVGLWGLTFVAVAVFASPAVLVDERSETRRPWAWPLAAVLALAALATYGVVRLVQSPTEFVEGVRLRIMQPNLQQDEKFNYGAKQSVMQRYLALSDRATGPDAMGVRDVTHLIWPESAFPFFIAREPDALAQIAGLLPAGTVLITGGVRPDEAPPPGAPVTHA